MTIGRKKRNRPCDVSLKAADVGLLAASLRKVPLVLLLVLNSCGSGEKPLPSSDILLSIGDSVLSERDVVEKIPIGLETKDSLALFHKIVGKWVESMVLTDMAKSKLPEIEEINRKVEDYRNRLIVAEYMRKMSAGKQIQVNPDSVRAFYERHRSEMVAETPLVKGIYIKLPDNSASFEEIKKCVFSATDKDIDRLEKNWIGEALQYDYFSSRWVAWDAIADQIPYRFYDPDAFLASTKNFKTSCNGSVYLLHVSEYLPSGSELPFDFASSRITSILTRSRIDSYEEALVRSLVKKAISDGRLKMVGYDPVSHKRLRYIIEKTYKK